MCPSSGLWGVVFDCDSHFTILSTLSFDGPQLRRFMNVCSSLVHIVPNVLPRSLCGCPRTSLHHWRKDTITRLCASYTCVT